MYYMDMLQSMDLEGNTVRALPSAVCVNERIIIKEDVMGHPWFTSEVCKSCSHPTHKLHDEEHIPL